jgi:hypothetical protein
LLETRHSGVIGDADMVRPDIGDQHGSLQSRSDTLSAAETESKDCQMRCEANDHNRITSQESYQS